MPNYNGVWSLSTQYQNVADWPVIPITGDVAFFGKASNTVALDYVVITTLGDSVNWGTLTVNHTYATGTGNTTRGLVMGGNSAGQTVTFMTNASAGTHGDFGDLIATQTFYNSNSHASATRALFFGPYSNTDSIEFFTIASAGNATAFGDMTARGYGAATGSTTRAVIGGGFTNQYINVIDYVTIASEGDSTDFGDLLSNSAGNSACSSNTRALFAGGISSGSTRLNVIAYVTIASAGNASDFGDLATNDGNYNIGDWSASNLTRGLFFNHVNSEADVQYVTIASTGNAAAFGDLTNNNASTANGFSFSNSHGGLA